MNLQDALIAARALNLDGERARPKDNWAPFGRYTNKDMPFK